jgi:drug/metabolite transporter (DMT)-like permease
MSYSLGHVGGGTAGIISQLTVLFAVAGGVLIFGDPIRPTFVAGAALTLTGVALTVLSVSPRLLSKLRID